MSEKKKKSLEEPEVLEKQTPETEEAPVAEEKTPEELLTQELETTKDRLLRTMAEFDNFRKRSIKEKETIYPDATANVLTQFLPVLDNFERAMACETTDESFRKGVEMIQNTLTGIFEKFEVKQFGAVGDTFDPELHNAVMHVEDEEKGENEIVEVLQTGYRLGDRILRFAMVKVAN